MPKALHCVKETEGRMCKGMCIRREREMKVTVSVGVEQTPALAAKVCRTLTSKGVAFLGRGLLW